MRCISLIDADLKALQKKIPSLDKDLKIRFIADKNKFEEFGSIDGFLQNVDGYKVHKIRLTTTQPPLKGKRGLRLWILVHEKKEVYIRCLIYPVESEPEFTSAVCYQAIHRRMAEWEKAQ